MTFEDILVATDLSDKAMTIMPHLAGLVGRLGARVTFAYADRRDHDRSDVGERLHERAIATHFEALREAAVAHGFEADTKVLSGEARAALRRTSHSARFDLIVLTHDGAAPIDASEAAAALASWRKPVLIFHAAVSAGQHASALPKPLTRMLVAVDPSDEQTSTAADAAAFARALGAKVIVGAVLKERGVGPGVGGAGPLVPPIPAHRRQDVAATQLRLTALCTSIDVAHSGAHVVVADDVAAGLVALAIDEGADVIVASPRARGVLARLFAGSVTKRLVALSPLPLLILPAEA